MNNLIDSPDHRATAQALRDRLESWMAETRDPMLEAFRKRSDRAAVDAVLRKTYGAP